MPSLTCPIRRWWRTRHARRAQQRQPDIYAQAQALHDAHTPQRQKICRDLDDLRAEAAEAAQYGKHALPENENTSGNSSTEPSEPQG